VTDELISPEELAAWLKVPVRTVYAWRYKDDGPPGFKVGRHVRYRRSDVDTWLAEQAEPRPAA
jgi:excisionase family DNA binding protein